MTLAQFTPSSFLAVASFHATVEANSARVKAQNGFTVARSKTAFLLQFSPFVFRSLFSFLFFFFFFFFFFFLVSLFLYVLLTMLCWFVRSFNVIKN